MSVPPCRRLIRIRWNGAKKYSQFHVLNSCMSMTSKVTQSLTTTSKPKTILQRLHPPSFWRRLCRDRRLRDLLSAEREPLCHRGLGRHQVPLCSLQHWTRNRILPQLSRLVGGIRHAEEGHDKL
jgi:hypothetical protein